jgi:hypothetical protein
MKAYKVTITMHDGSQGVHRGIYESGFAAIEAAKDAFGDAKRVSAEPLASTQGRWYIARERHGLRLRGLPQAQGVAHG